MADGVDGSQAEELSSSGRIVPSRNPSGSQREELGGRLAELTGKLTTIFEDLRDAWPDESREETADYWSNGLLDIRHGVERCQRVAKDCRTFIAGDEGRQLPELAHKQLEDAIKQFSGAIRDARSATLAAVHALETPQDPALRADLYEKAVDQLADLTERCTGLTTQMRGERGLSTGTRAPAEAADP
jgi:hypothetical protein